MPPHAADQFGDVDSKALDCALPPRDATRPRDTQLAQSLHDVISPT